MNTNILKKVGFYILGAAIGGGAGALIVDQVIKARDKKSNDSWQKQSWDEEPNKWEAEQDAKYYLDDKEVWLATEHPELKPLLGEEEIVITDEKRLKKKVEKVKIVDYSALARRNQKLVDINKLAQERLGDLAVVEGDTVVVDENGLEVVEPIEARQEVQQDPTAVRIISLEEFAAYADVEDVVRATLTYYEMDDVLVDMEENVLKVPEDYVGDSLLHFGENCDDPDMVYVWNPKRTMAYEIARILDKPYTEAVLHIVNEKRSSRSRRKVKKTNDAPSEDE